MRALSLDLLAGPLRQQSVLAKPDQRFFTFAFPLMFLVIFTSLFGSGTVHLGTLSVKQTSYYVAAMAAYGVITSCYANIANGVTYQRDAGVLKRTNGTPLPSAAFLAARVIHASLIAILLVAITAAFGRIAYGATSPPDHTHPIPDHARRRRRRLLRARPRTHEHSSRTPTPPTRS